MTACVIVCEQLSAGYHGVAAIQDIDLEVHPGQIVLLGGRNGAGKSTTVMTIAGAIRPLSGKVRFNDSQAAGPVHRRVRRGLGLITEERCVVRGLTVQDNLKLGRGDPGLALHYFPELEQRRGVKAGFLSGGEQQMLALGRVLAARPNVILADELSQGLAPIMVRRLLDALVAAAADGVGILLVEQHVHLALEIADHAYFLRRGRVHTCGTRDIVSDRDIHEAYF